MNLIWNSCIKIQLYSYVLKYSCFKWKHFKLGQTNLGVKAKRRSRQVRFPMFLSVLELLTWPEYEHFIFARKQ